MARRNSSSGSTNNPVEIWQDFIKAEIKKGSKLGKIVEPAEFGGFDTNDLTLTLYFSDDNQRKQAQGQRDKIQKILSTQFRLGCDRIDFKTGTAPSQRSLEENDSFSDAWVTDNPLQALYWVEPILPADNDSEPRLHILKSAISAEKNCDPIYQHLNVRTKELSGDLANTLKVKFDWRLRVGGTRGYRDLLLPVLHPVFGIPYIPASSLKGITRAWSEGGSNTRDLERERLLGDLEHGLGRVEFLDAFPTSACLSIDVATPQWHWTDGQHPKTRKLEQFLEYRPDPHPLMSLEKPEFLIGLSATSIGNQDDVQRVKSWLEAALHQGVGSRVSSGYGYPTISDQGTPKSKRTSSITIPFTLWTQGSYGSDPPTKQNHYKGTPEFRPTALRGIVRYWFRAVALALYPPEICKSHEEELFGTLGQQGLVSIRATAREKRSEQPYAYKGDVQILAQDDNIAQLIKQLIILASCLGGMGHGSRRPLHQVKGYWRGCYWELELPELPYPSQLDSWHQLIEETRRLVTQWKPSKQNYTIFPGKPEARRQDVLDRNAQVWLLSSPISQGKRPSQVNWAKEASSPQVRGSGLNLLYSDPKFKGKSLGNPGNPKVGGALQRSGNTPSYVWIKSVFPNLEQPYQVITIFGANDPDRSNFAKEIKKNGGVLAWGNQKKIIKHQEKLQ